MGFPESARSSGIVLTRFGGSERDFIAPCREFVGPANDQSLSAALAVSSGPSPSVKPRAANFLRHLDKARRSICWTRSLEMPSSSAICACDIPPAVNRSSPEVIVRLQLIGSVQSLLEFIHWRASPAVGIGERFAPQRFAFLPALRFESFPPKPHLNAKSEFRHDRNVR